MTSSNLYPMLERAAKSLGHLRLRITLGRLWPDGRLLQRGQPAGGGSGRAARVIATNQGLETAPGAAELCRPRGRALQGLTVRDRMERTLLTKRGRRLYKSEARP